LLAGAFVTFLISAGLMHCYAVFLVAFLEDFRWSRAEASLAYSVSQLVSGITAPLVGALVDRLGPRRLVQLGGLLLAVGLGGYRLAFLLAIASHVGGCITFWAARHSACPPGLKAPPTSTPAPDAARARRARRCACPRRRRPAR
jgi:MFS family permease